MDLIDFHPEKRRKHWSVVAQTDGAPFEISETEVSGEMAFSNHRLDGSVEDVHEFRRILLVGVTAHRGFIDRDFATARLDQRFKFGADDGQKSLR